ncbi:MGDG synthase family glycosyltransferase [Bacillus sp. SCS-151]|uniref:MGDG synthase family glycosyltransferase n=1 Tax=Nanhaiella sioensis TaxID=3115293 RepID=UPI00397CCE6E
MKKVLFLPLLRMPSGHHQVSEAFIHSFNCHDQYVKTKKIDLLSHSNPLLEKFITSFYLKWIKLAPQSYEWVYKNFGYSSSKNYSLQWYELFFLRNMEKLLQEEKPDLIVATHGFPSFLVSCLKVKNKIDIPLVNVYTDFFINNVWGREGVDFHFVSSEQMKTYLIDENGLSPDKIILTGIPISEVFNGMNRQFKQKERYHILISGGSSGLGNITDFLSKVDIGETTQFSVLCGKNEKLYQDLKNSKNPYITPYPYISSREKMNDLYEDVDAIVTKPGGVTVSEALQKRLPIFIESALPGQEDFNLAYLQEKALVYKLNANTPLNQQLMDKLNNKENWEEHQRRIEEHVQSFHNPYEQLLQIMKTTNRIEVGYVG